MNCNWSESRLEALLDGELPEHERARLLAHLGTCAGCRDVYDELRAVDALLMTPRRVELAENFTFATMAEVRALRPPHRRAMAVAPYLLSYLAASWIVIGAASLLLPAQAHGLVAAVFDLARAFGFAFSGLAGSLERFLVRDTRIGPSGWLAFALMADIALACAGAGLFAVLRPRFAERLRS